MAGLLISVRNGAEARRALAGGAALLDVKQPSRGSLGRADDEVIAEVLDAAGDVPTSAAMGELIEASGDSLHLGRLSFVKWGLAGACADWRERLAELRGRVERGSRCRVALAAYADHRRAEAPPLAEVAHHAVQAGYAALLLDTFHKDGMTLLDWLSVQDVAGVIASCRAAGVRVALAGGLGRREIAALLATEPDWFAVRGAACDGGRRDAELDEERVRVLARLVGG